MSLIEPIEVTLTSNVDEKGKLKDQKLIGRVFASRNIVEVGEVDGKTQSTENVQFAVAWYNRIHKIGWLEATKLTSLGAIVDHNTDSRLQDFERRLSNINKFAEEVDLRLETIESDIDSIFEDDDDEEETETDFHQTSVHSADKTI